MYWLVQNVKSNVHFIHCIVSKQGGHTVRPSFSKVEITTFEGGLTILPCCDNCSKFWKLTFVTFGFRKVDEASGTKISVVETNLDKTTGHPILLQIIPFQFHQGFSSPISLQIFPLHFHCGFFHSNFNLKPVFKIQSIFSYNFIYFICVRKHYHSGWGFQHELLTTVSRIFDLF